LSAAGGGNHVGTNTDWPEPLTEDMGWEQMSLRHAGNGALFYWNWSTSGAPQ